MYSLLELIAEALWLFGDAVPFERLFGDDSIDKKDREDIDAHRLEVSSESESESRARREVAVHDNEKNAADNKKVDDEKKIHRALAIILEEEDF